MFVTRLHGPGNILLNLVNHAHTKDYKRTAPLSRWANGSTIRRTSCSLLRPIPEQHYPVNYESSSKFEGPLMLLKNRLFTPGPTPLLPAAQTAMASYFMHHRTADFRALYSRVLSDMKDFIGTQNDVLVLAASGTGVMEGAVSNLTSPGDRVLVLTAGKFGERWRDLARAFGCEVELVSAPYGQTFQLAEIRKALHPGIRAIYMQSTETSTAVRHDVEAIARLIKEVTPQALLVV